MLALVIIIIIDLLVVAALFYFGVREGEHHDVSTNSPAIKALSGGPAGTPAESHAAESVHSGGAE